MLSSETASSSTGENRETPQDFLNPYQPLINMTLQKKGEYLTLTTVTVHKTENSFSNFNTDAILANECVLKEYEHVDPDTMRQLHPNTNYSINVDGRDPKWCLSNIKGVSLSCNNLTSKRPSIIQSGKERTFKNPTEDFRLDYYKMFKTRSESDMFF